ncbi:MAG: AMP-binding protein [Streptosporangiaceae bacterium]
MAELTQLTLHSMIDRTARQHPGRQAVVLSTPSGERTLSYGELAENAARLAGGLRRLGLHSGDCLLSWLPNIPEWFVVEVAAASLGIVAIPVNTRYRAAEMANILDASQARVVIVAEGFAGVDFSALLGEAVRGSRLEHVIDVSGTADRAVPWRGLLTGDSAAPHGQPTDLANVFCTSGTTSSPKLAAHDQASIVTHADNDVRAYGIRPGDVMLLSLPVSGVFGFSGAMAALSAGATAVLQPIFNADEALELMARYTVTHFYGPDGMLRAVLDAAGGPHPGFDRWRWGAFANFTGKPMELVETAERFADVQLHGTYGSSECFALMSAWPRDAPPDVRAQGGGYLVSRDMEVRCVDPETDAVRQPGEPGELQFRGYNVLPCYLGNPEATSAAFTDDGWFRSGDLGELRPDEAFVYLARLKDSLRLRGYLVDPQEIEEQLLDHPAVEAVQLVGVWRAGEGDIPVAFVRPRDLASPDEQALVDFARRRMASYKVPRRILTVDEFPTTDSPNGRKIQKHRLRETARKELGL